MSTSPHVVALGGVSRPLAWTNAALYRADELDLMSKFAAGKFGYSTLCKTVWCMLDDAGRKALPTPEAVSEHIPLKEAANVWEVAMRAYSAANGGEDSPAKKETGGTAPSPA